MQVKTTTTIKLTAKDVNKILKTHFQQSMGITKSDIVFHVGVISSFDDRYDRYEFTGATCTHDAEVSR